MLPVRIGFYLALRQIKRSTKWSTILIIVIMILTFLNLIVISGVLVGLIEGAVAAQRDRNTSDLFITTLRGEPSIENTQDVIRIAESLPYSEAVSARFSETGTVEANYKDRKGDDDVREEVGTSIIGIDPVKENEVTNLSEFMLEGEYLQEGDFDQVVIGYLLLKRYFNLDSATFLTLEDVYPGSKVRIRLGDVTREVTVKGIIKSKVDDIDRSVFLTDTQFRSITNRFDLNANQILVKLENDTLELSERGKQDMIANGVDKIAKVQTFEDAQPKFLNDIKETFSILGAITSSFGLVVAAITIFIVIFINAITRRRQIGIMKAIGISGKAIELSYVFQSLFYAVIGSFIGVVIVYALLVPYFLANPIQFPFSDGILSAPVSGTVWKVALLIVTTMIAGYIPSRIIVTKNTLDSVLGRK
jgi:putative ABC transport system permease protein